MTKPDWYAEGERRRALSKGLEPVVWPPRVGDRLHVNSGFADSSWEGEARAVVDGKIVVFLCRRRFKSDSMREWYMLEKHGSVRAWGREHLLCYGPLPDELRLAEDE